MRRRILQSTLLVVTITALVLGLPLGIATWRLVEDIKLTSMTEVLTRVETGLGDEDRNVQLSDLELVVPTHSRLLIEQPGRAPQVVGEDVGPNPVSQSLPFAGGGQLMLEEPRSELLGQQVQVTLIVLLLALLSIGAGTVVATLTARRLALPLSDVADRAARLGAGDFRAAPSRHGIPELDRVSDVLDTSALALAELVQRERDLVGDVSHQLRSRLTALQLRLDELATHPDPEARREALAALEQTEKLTAVLDELLEAARAARSAGAELQDLKPGLTAVADEWRPTLKAAGRSFKVRVPDGLLARVTPARIREAVVALVDNAVQHGGGTVTLSARSTEAGVLVEVADNGPGVPEDLVPHVFDRGVSGESSSGLGLALARALVEADGGRLELARVRPAMFTIFLPPARADDVLSAPRVPGGPR